MLALTLRRGTTVVAATCVSLLLGGCGSSLLAQATATSSTTTSTTAPTPTTVPISGEIAVAYPVNECTNASGQVANATGWKPTVLMAPIPTSLVGKLAFYTDGTHVVLGPSGWTCTVVNNNVATPPSANVPSSTYPGESTTVPTTIGPLGGTVGAIGATVLVVYPSTEPDAPISGTPAAGAEGVFAAFDTTASTAGISMVCPFFTLPSWQQSQASCSSTKPAGETAATSTPDLVTVTDAVGQAGNLAGSGGQHPVTGTVIFPQVQPDVTDGTAVHVAAESCSIIDPTLCPTILSDFDVRSFPAPAAPTYSYTYTYPTKSYGSSSTSAGGTTYGTTPKAAGPTG